MQARSSHTVSQLVVFKGATLDIWIIGGRGVVVSTSALESEDPGSIPGVSKYIFQMSKIASDSLEPSLGLTPDRVHSKISPIKGGEDVKVTQPSHRDREECVICIPLAEFGILEWNASPAPPIQSVSLVVFKGASLDIWIIGGRGVVVSTSALESEDPGFDPRRLQYIFQMSKMASDSLEPSLGLTPDRVHSKNIPY